MYRNQVIRLSVIYHQCSDYWEFRRVLCPNAPGVCKAQAMQSGGKLISGQCKNGTKHFLRDASKLTTIVREINIQNCVCGEAVSSSVSRRAPPPPSSLFHCQRTCAIWRISRRWPYHHTARRSQESVMVDRTSVIGR